MNPITADQTAITVAGNELVSSGALTSVASVVEGSVFVFVGTSTLVQKVARICANDTGVTYGGANHFTTYTEVLLECRNVFVSAGNPTSTTFNGDEEILIAFRQSGTNFICSYTIADVDTVMEDKLNSCKQGTGMLDLRRFLNQSSCLDSFTFSQQNIITTCNQVGPFTQFLEVDQPLMDTTLTRFASEHPFTSLHVTSLEGTTYIFAGTTGGLVQVSGCLHVYTFIGNYSYF